MPDKTKGRPAGRPSTRTSEGTPLDRLRAAAAVEIGDPTAKAVWMEYGRHADDNWQGFVGQATIAATLELGESTVRRKVAYLERIGRLSRERRWKANGARTSDLYTMHVAVPLDVSGREADGLPLDDDASYRSLRAGKSQREESATPPLPPKGQSAPAREEDPSPQLDHSGSPQLEQSDAKRLDVSEKGQQALPLAPGGRPEDALSIVPWDVLLEVFTPEQLMSLGFRAMWDADPPTFLRGPASWHPATLNGHARDPLFRTTLRRQAERARALMEAV